MQIHNVLIEFISIRESLHSMNTLYLYIPKLTRIKCFSFSQSIEAYGARKTADVDDIIFLVDLSQQKMRNKVYTVNGRQLRIAW